MAVYVALLLLFVAVAWGVSTGLGWPYGDEALMAALIVTAAAAAAVVLIA